MRPNPDHAASINERFSNHKVVHTQLQNQQVFVRAFWGILKRERYYGKRFTDRGTLVKMIEDYIDYYNNKRLQRNLGTLTPMEKHEIYLQAA